MAAGAVLAGLALTQALAEVKPYFIGGIQPEQRFAVIASGDFEPAYSRWSRNLFLNDCLDVPRTIYGLAQPPARRDALFENCRRHAEAIVATTPTAALGWLDVASTMVPMFGFMIAVGLASPMALTKAVSIDPAAAGSAAGLYGSAQMACGALCTAAAGFGTSPALAAAVTMAVAALVGTAAAALALAREGR